MLQTMADCIRSGQPPYNCQGCDLSGLNLAGLDLTGANLTSATLIGTTFKGVLSMAGADLTDATMGNGTDFSGCDLSTTNFGDNVGFGSTADHPTKFIGATVPYQALGSAWSYLDLTDATISDPPQDLSSLAVTQSNLTRMDLSGKVLENAHFYGVTLAAANFSDARLGHIVFTSTSAGTVCDLTDARFGGASIPYGVFDTSTLTGADFTGAVLEHASFLQTRMDGTEFDHTNLTTCDFSIPPRFSSDPSALTSFRGTTLNYSTIQKNWSYLDLTGATLVGLEPSGDLTYLEAQYSVLTGMDFSNYTLNDCNLTGATLTGVKFTKAKMRNALLYGVRNSCELFKVPQGSTADYRALLTALRQSSADGLAVIFANHGLSISTGQTTVRADDEGVRWTITDASTKAVYQAIKGPGAHGATTLIVVEPGLVTRFDGADLRRANFSPHRDQPAVLRGAIFSNATMDETDLSSADLGQVNPHDPATASQFDGASMNGVGLAQADLTGAQLTGTVYLHNADLSSITLKGADLTGAQLGALSEVLRVPRRPTSDYQALLAALEDSSAAEVRQIFAKHGLNLTAAQLTVATEVPDRSWTITDGASQTTYAVLNWTSNDDSTFLVVTSPTQAAKLTGAYMPDTTLLDANLYGVDATYVQLYGEDVNLGGAILDTAKFSNANLGGSNVSVRALYNVDMAGVNLINARIKGADLTQGVSLARAHLQGADFTDCKMNEANLDSAAVSVGLDSTTSGVYLFSLTADHPDFQAVLRELQKAVLHQINLMHGQKPSAIEQSLKALASGELDPLRSLFQKFGVTFSADAKVESTQDPSAWQILDNVTPPGNYTVWHGRDVSSGKDALLSRPSLPTLQQVVKETGSAAGELRWQALVTQGGGPQQWVIDNDSENPENLQLGYATLLVTEEQLPDRSLSFYGTSLRIEQLGDRNALQIRLMSYPPTILCQPGSGGEQPCNDDGSDSLFGPDTVCPNSRKLSENQNDDPSVPWPQMLRATAPPTPPRCVPSPFAPCPQTSDHVTCDECLASSRA